jgi:uncharacterized protein (DUF1684 family)
MIDISKWKKQLERERQEKNRFFMLHPQSPLPIKDRTKLKGGLDVYPPDPAYRFELELYEHEDKEVIRVEATKGEMREFIRWGEFRFKLHNQACTLQAYKSALEEKRLFVPFRDATSGKETYGAGRYMDLEPEEHRTNDGKWVLDLNKAYNPWCAYSEDYTCPLVPPENWLKVPVRAGEKDYRH